VEDQLLPVQKSKNKMWPIVGAVMALFIVVGVAVAAYYVSNKLNTTASVAPNAAPGSQASGGCTTNPAQCNAKKGETCVNGVCKVTKPPTGSTCTPTNCPGPEFYCSATGACLNATGYCGTALCSGTCDKTDPAHPVCKTVTTTSGACSGGGKVCHYGQCSTGYQSTSGTCDGANLVCCIPLSNCPNTDCNIPGSADGAIKCSLTNGNQTFCCPTTKPLYDGTKCVAPTTACSGGGKVCHYNVCSTGYQSASGTCTGTNLVCCAPIPSCPNTDCNISGSVVGVIKCSLTNGNQTFCCPTATPLFNGTKCVAKTTTAQGCPAVPCTGVQVCVSGVCRTPAGIDLIQCGNEQCNQTTEKCCPSGCKLKGQVCGGGTPTPTVIITPEVGKCVATQLFLQKADGTYNTTPMTSTQLNSLKVGNKIRMTVAGSLADLKARFRVKIDGIVDGDWLASQGYVGTAKKTSFYNGYEIKKLGTYIFESQVSTKP